MAGKARQGKLLVLGDSFFTEMRPFFEQQFETVKKIHDGRGAGSSLLTQAILDAEKPDAVLIESVERYWSAD